MTSSHVSSRAAVVVGSSNVPALSGVGSKGANTPRDHLLESVRSNDVKVKKGATGEVVRQVQSDLLEVARKMGLHSNLEGSKELKEGRFGKRTYELLCEIQGKLKLTKTDGSLVELVQDGIVGPRTQRAIDIYLGREVIDINQFAEMIGNDWTGYDYSSNRARKFYESEGINFNEVGYNPYFGSQSSPEFKGKNIRISQTEGWNCGPTSAAMAVAPLLGVHPGQLDDFFTNIQRRHQGARGMGWDMPPIFAKAVGLRCEDLGDPGVDELERRIRAGERIQISVNNRTIRKGKSLTGGGHLIALGQAVRDDQGVLWFENLDPNGKNINTKGFGWLRADEVAKVMKNAWSYTGSGSKQP